MEKRKRNEIGDIVKGSVWVPFRPGGDGVRARLVVKETPGPEAPKVLVDADGTEKEVLITVFLTYYVLVAPSPNLRAQVVKKSVWEMNPVEGRDVCTCAVIRTPRPGDAKVRVRYKNAGTQAIYISSL